MGYIYVEEYKIDYNPEVFKKPELIIFSDKTQPFAGNYTVETIKTIKKVKIYLFVKIPENENDREFQREAVKTVIDCGKFLNGIYANPFVRYMVKSALPSAEFELKLPFKPVSLLTSLDNLTYTSLNIQGVYRFVNFSVPEPPFPFNQMNTTAVLNMRFIANIEGSKNNVYIGNIWFRGGFRKFL